MFWLKYDYTPCTVIALETIAQFSRRWIKTSTRNCFIESHNRIKFPWNESPRVSHKWNNKLINYYPSFIELKLGEFHLNADNPFSCLIDSVIYIFFNGSLYYFCNFKLYFVKLIIMKMSDFILMYHTENKALIYERYSITSWTVRVIKRDDFKQGKISFSDKI